MHNMYVKPRYYVRHINNGNWNTSATAEFA